VTRHMQDAEMSGSRLKWKGGSLGGGGGDHANKSPEHRRLGGLKDRIVLTATIRDA